MKINRKRTFLAALLLVCIVLSTLTSAEDNDTVSDTGGIVGAGVVGAAGIGFGINKKKRRKKQ